MRYVVCDTEVFAHDNIVVFKDVETQERAIYHNDNDSIREYLEQPGIIYVTANGKNYDQYILKAMALDFSPEEIKAINDYIIVEKGFGWQHPLFKGTYFHINICDLYDDKQIGLDLKSIEAHLGMDIHETEVDFNLDRPLNQEELELTVKYCCFDVDATEQLLKLRKDYIKNKINIGKLSGLPEEKAIYMTNAKLTAAFLQATPVKFNDARKYEYPNNLKKEYIPNEVFEFFNRIYDESLTDEQAFKGQLKINIGNCEATLGFGGIHADCGNCIIEADDDTVIINEDVASYYPHLMTINHYCSRAIPNPQIYEDMLERRMAAKKSGDIATANALKLVANTTYGATLSEWSDLYDPLMGRSVCISGQLYLLELAEHCYQVPSCEIIQLNTDGIMLKCSKADEPIITDICQEWQDRTHFELEKDSITKVIQKDVNNYIEVKNDGSVKAKGGYLVKGVGKAGAFKINNNFTIVSKAVLDYFTKGIPVEETINNCSNPLEFQIVAKSGSTYGSTFWYVDNQKIPVQKVNRVYATNDSKYGILVKVHKETGSEQKIASLPPHCIVDNSNEIDIKNINKDWYIALAKKYIDDYLGIQPPKLNTRKINKCAKDILKYLDTL